MQRFTVARGTSFRGTTGVPGDKSISHRAVMLGSIATGETRVSGFLNGADCIATLAAFEAMGVRIERPDPHSLRIAGVGIGGLRTPSAPLDLGNSGTSCRLLAGLLAGQGMAATLTGDQSLRSRPMERVAVPLRLMGANVTTTGGRAPLQLIPGAPLHAVDYVLPVASAQLKSAVLLAGLGAVGRTVVRSPGPSRDHTEHMLAAMGVPLEIDADEGIIRLDGPAGLTGCDIEVPGDLSSAAFLLTAAVVGATGPVTVTGVGVNPTRDGVLTILDAMGARIRVENRRLVGTEPVADITAERSELRGIEIPPSLVPLAIDEFPALCVAAATASGSTVISGAAELRHKETDRIAAMAAALAAVGIDVEQRPDGMKITGGRMTGGVVDAREDHRIAMSMSVAALASSGRIEVRDTDNVATSFPGFVETLRFLGLEVAVDRLQAG
jgi:3-phosphoshikimate 1-carboxyvinyltransferase